LKILKPFDVGSSSEPEALSNNLGGRVREMEAPGPASRHLREIKEWSTDRRSQVTIPV
jgi:hypothetical protein